MVGIYKANTKENTTAAMLSDPQKRDVPPTAQKDLGGNLETQRRSLALPGCTGARLSSLSPANNSACALLLEHLHVLVEAVGRTTKGPG